MLGTYASFLLVVGLAAIVGQAVFAACGRRTWSWLAPAVGLGAICALSWGVVRLPGEGTAVAIALGCAGALALLVVWGRIEDLASALRAGLPFGLAAVLVASIPFFVEGRFGIMGTGLNPDMSQHLFAVDRLAAGGTERLISEGYPLGPHSLVVGLAELGPSTVQAFDGVALAVAVASCLAPLALLAELHLARRYAGALVVGFAYLVAAFFVQGAFKETLQALFVLTFAIGLHQLAREWPLRTAAPRALRAVPLAVIAIGSAYTYSFPGLAWLAGVAAVWAAVELGGGGGRGGGGEPRGLVFPPAPTAAVALLVLAAAVAPEVGRMAKFADFETFNPSGAGLGNLFNRLSPLEALGIWPSGDFRLEPGDGAVPAIAFYAGAALGLAALGLGLAWGWRRGDRAVLGALAAASVLWLYALAAGTPYQEAKALLLVAPLVSIIAVRALLADGPALLTLAYLGAAGISTAVVLANGPIGPESYSPALAELRTQLGPGSTLVLAPRQFLDEEHGRDYLTWELRGNRICVDQVGSGRGLRPPPGVATVIKVDENAEVDSFSIPERGHQGPGRCPLISVGARADPGADD
jgi:hypothetical protein